MVPFILFTFRNCFRIKITLVITVCESVIVRTRRSCVRIAVIVLIEKNNIGCNINRIEERTVNKFKLASTVTI